MLDMEDKRLYSITLVINIRLAGEGDQSLWDIMVVVVMMMGEFRQSTRIVALFY